jgi:hypothetical protein
MSYRMLAVSLAMGGLLIAADRPQIGTEAKFVVTVADHMNHKPQILNKEDFSDTASMRIESIQPLYGGSQIYIVIDDAANYDFGAKLEELRSFVRSQPASTAVGLAFIKDGQLKVVQTPVEDRDLVARELRAPSGSKPANPYYALSSLIQGWQANAGRREVVMITSGIDSSANAEAAIADAERAGVEVFSIYHPVADYATQEWREVDTGVVDLAHVSYETGGEAYFISHNATETITPFLDDIAEHLTNQYLVTVVFDSAAEPGFREVTLNPTSPKLELMAPAKVWVEAKGTR